LFLFLFLFLQDEKKKYDMALKKNILIF